MRVRLPRPDEHVAIAGRTGSGKTQAAIDMLSRRDLSKQAWIVIDHKRDEKVGMLPATPLSISPRFLPDRGLYRVRPDLLDPNHASDLEDLMLRCLRKGKIGLHIDEGHCMPVNSPALKAILTMGREKKCVVNWCAQRATNISPYVWSQASIYRCFALQTPNDIKRFNENFPVRYSGDRLKKYWSYWYDIPEGQMYVVPPARDIQESLDALSRQVSVSFRKV